MTLLSSNTIPAKSKIDDAVKQTGKAKFTNPPDIVDRYFKEMGSISTLNREEEINIAQTIEETSAEFLYRISQLPIIPETILLWRDQCRRKDRKWDETFRIRALMDSGKMRKVLPADREKLLDHEQ